MKKTTLAAFAALLLAGTAAQAQEVLRIGTEGAYPPFSQTNADGSLSGFDIDIAEALCAEMKRECTLVSQDWDGIIPALQANKYDAIVASMSITDERREQVDFTDKYYSTPPALLVRSELPVDRASFDAVAGLTLGAQSSSVHANYVEDRLTSATLRTYPTPAEYQADLSAGRIDGAVDDIIVLSEWANSDANDCCRVVTGFIADPQIYGDGIGIAVRKGEDELREAFNDAIEAIRENGTYDEIVERYFSFDIYGG